MPDFERTITFDPAFDKRDPNPAKNYGIHGVTLRFVLKGTQGAVQFVLYTNWYLPHVQQELDLRLDDKFPHLSCHPMPADLGYHSPVPRSSYQADVDGQDDCSILGGRCYYDGSALNAEPVYERLLREGDAGVWAALEKYYGRVFGSGVKGKWHAGT